MYVGVYVYICMCICVYICLHAKEGNKQDLRCPPGGSTLASSHGIRELTGSFKGSYRVSLKGFGVDRRQV